MSFGRVLEMASGPVLTLGGGTALWQLAQQAPPTSGAGNEVMSAGLLISAIAGLAGAIGFLYREGRKATDAAGASLNAAHTTHVNGIELLHRELLAAKDQTIAAKDETIRSLEDRCGVLDGRVVSTGQEYQQTVHKFLETATDLSRQMQQLTESVTSGAHQSAEEHKEMIHALRGDIPHVQRRRRVVKDT